MAVGSVFDDVVVVIAVVAFRIVKTKAIISFDVFRLHLVS